MARMTLPAPVCFCIPNLWNSDAVDRRKALVGIPLHDSAGIPFANRRSPVAVTAASRTLGSGSFRPSRVASRAAMPSIRESAQTAFRRALGDGPPSTTRHRAQWIQQEPVS